jgi:hypothetical protein
MDEWKGKRESDELIMCSCLAAGLFSKSTAQKTTFGQKKAAVAASFPCNPCTAYFMLLLHVCCRNAACT